MRLLGVDGSDLLLAEGGSLRLVVAVSPQNLMALEITATSVLLGWDAVEGAAQYEIERDGVVVGVV